MEDRIFFKDKTNSLKGPFTERQIQEWYRDKWFENSFSFYFTKSDEPPSDLEKGGITLDSLRYFNGIGCPFKNIYEETKRNHFEKKRLERENKLEKIEKEIKEMQHKCSEVHSLEKMITRAEEKLEKLASSRQKKEPIAEPDKKVDQSVKEGVCQKEATSESRNVKQSFEEIGNDLASFVLDAFAVYETGNFASWDKERTSKMMSVLNGVKGEKAIRKRNIVCEQILIEKMKEKDFFCCDLCQESLFNYKQALIHLTSDEHSNKQHSKVVRSGVPLVRVVLNSFTKLPEILSMEDKKGQVKHIMNTFFGSAFPGIRGPGMRPLGDWVYDFCIKYAQLICTEDFWEKDPFTGEFRYSRSTASILRATEVAVGNMKGPVGRKMMAELHEHLGQASTNCVFCGANTGNREEFYAHLISAQHMASLGRDRERFDLLTMVVNVHRKDLI